MLYQALATQAKVVSRMKSLLVLVSSMHLLTIRKIYHYTYPLKLSQRQRGRHADRGWWRLTEPRWRGQVTKLNTSIPAQHQQPAYSQLGAISSNSTCQSMDLDLSLCPDRGARGSAISPEDCPYPGD